MKVTPIHTPKVLPGTMTIFELLNTALPTIPKRSIVVITSKIVALCENRVIPVKGTDRQRLIQKEADWYHYSKSSNGDHPYYFTITQDTLIPASGIDISNGNGYYVLWPQNPRHSAGLIRNHLAKHHRRRHLGVIITDSTISLSRWGTLGIAIGHSGFNPIRDYIGRSDLFGRPLDLSQANVAGGLAAAAVLTMGEGAEQTPIALIEDVPTVEFLSEKPPTNQQPYYISPLEDRPFQPFFARAEWRRGSRPHSPGHRTAS